MDENLPRGTRRYVRVEGDEFAVRVSNVAYDTRTGRAVLAGTRLDVERALASRLKAHTLTLKLRLAQAASLAGFAAELDELVAICCRTDVNSHVALPSAKYYGRLMAELDVIGWNRLRELRDDLRTLELETQDAGHRTHSVRVLLPLEYESEGSRAAPECLVDAPEALELQWPTPNRVLLDEVLTQFQSFLDKFQDFWDVLDALEPRQPTRATRRRRLALERHASVQFQVDVEHPKARLNELSFFGNQATVGMLREKWGSNASRWDDVKSLQENLEHVLEVTLPSPKTTGVCGGVRHLLLVSFRRRGWRGESMQRKTDQGSRIPDRLCENANCNQPFHAKCLVDWLRALPTSRQSFHTVFGECPYCREAISAKFQPDF